MIRSLPTIAAALVLTACAGVVGDVLRTPAAPVSVPSVDLTNAHWTKLSPDQPDSNPLRAAIVARDDKIGATRVVLKVPAGFTLPPYWLTSAGTYTVLKGTFVFDTIDAEGRPGKTVHKRGAFARVPPHLIQRGVTKPGEEGLLYITVYGDWTPQFADGAWGPKPPQRAGS